MRHGQLNAPRPDPDPAHSIAAVVDTGTGVEPGVRDEVRIPATPAPAAQALGVRCHRGGVDGDCRDRMRAVADTGARPEPGGPR